MSVKINKIIYNKERFEKALETLKEAVTEKNVTQYVKDSVIKRFEYTYETAWRLIKAILEYKGIVALYPRDIFREASSAGWLKNLKVWEGMIEDRNSTSHVYTEKRAEKIYVNICNTYFPEFQNLQKKLTEVIADDILGYKGSD